ATSSPSLEAAVLPLSTAALTAPTSPRTITVTSPEPIFSVPTKVTSAAFDIAPAASIAAVSPLVSTIPKASCAMIHSSCIRLLIRNFYLLRTGLSPYPKRLFSASSSFPPRDWGSHNAVPRQSSGPQLPFRLQRLPLHPLHCPG